MGIALALLLIPGSAGAGGQGEFTVPIVLEEGRDAPDVIDPASVPVPPQVRTVVDPPIVPPPPQIQTEVEPTIVPPPPQLRQVIVPTSVPPPQVQQQQVQGNGVGTTPTSSKLVSNLGQGDSTTAATFNIDSAQAFTTGGDAEGYRLTSVKMSMRAPSSEPGYKVEIWSGLGVTKLGTLNKPDSLSTMFAVKSFTANRRRHRSRRQLDVLGGGRRVQPSYAQCQHQTNKY